MLPLFPLPVASLRCTRRDARAGLLSFAAVTVVAAGSGCASIAKSLAKGAAKGSVEHDLILPGVPSQADLERFTRCFGARGGACPAAAPAGLQGARPVRLSTAVPPRDRVGTASLSLATAAADLARDVLNHPVQTQFNDLYNLVQGIPRAELSAGYRSATPTLQIDLKELDDYLQSVEAATALGGWDALATELQSRGDESSRTTLYIAAYLRAYFRDGSFFEFSLTTQGLVDRLKEQLKKSLPLLDDAQIEALVKKLLKDYFDLEEVNGQYPPQPIFGKLGTGGFVARGGKGYQFPSIEARLDPTAARKLTVSHVDFVATGSDVLRVILHAIGDAHAGLPAVSNATGTMLPRDPLPRNTPGTAGHLSAEEFGEVEVFADRLEGLTGAAVGRVTRGLWWVALNNEALATVIETAVAVAARKVSEKAAWCWFSCELGRDGAPTLAGAAPLKVKVRITGADRLIAP